MGINELILQFKEKYPKDKLIELFVHFDSDDIENLDDDDLELISKLINCLREYYIDNNSELYKFNNDNNLEPEIVDVINKIVKKTLTVYDDFGVLRSSNDIVKNLSLLDDVFDIFVLRNNPSYFETYFDSINNMHEFSKLQLQNFISGYRALVYDCISKTFGESSIKKAVEENTRVDQIFVNKITDQIDNNYKELQMNYITTILYRLS